MTKQLLLLCGMLAMVGGVFLPGVPPGRAVEATPSRRPPMFSIRLAPQNQMPPPGYEPPNVKIGYLCPTLELGTDGAIYLYDTPWRQLTDKDLRSLLWRKQPLEAKNGHYVLIPFGPEGEREVSVRTLATALTRLRMHADPATPTVVAVQLSSLNKRKP